MNNVHYKYLIELFDLLEEKLSISKCNFSFSIMNKKIYLNINYYNNMVTVNINPNDYSADVNAENIKNIICQKRK